jgi:MFS family permease
MQQMGWVLSALGFGGALGSLSIPLLSDHLGRKPVMLLAVVAAVVGLFVLAHTGPNVAALFGLVALVSGLVLSLMALTIGPVSAEAVTANLVSTATGLVVGVGEIFGGGVAPFLAGFGAKHFGIGSALYIPIGALCCGFVAVAFLKKTAPARARPDIGRQE